jgi:hypothetical protein
VHYWICAFIRIEQQTKDPLSGCQKILQSLSLPPACLLTQYGYGKLSQRVSVVNGFYLGKGTWFSGDNFPVSLQDLNFIGGTAAVGPASWT